MPHGIGTVAVDYDDTVLYSKFFQASGLLKQLRLTSEFESDLQYTDDWGSNRLFPNFASFIKTI